MTGLALSCLLALTLVVYLGVFVFANRRTKPRTGPIAPMTNPTGQGQVSDRLSVLTWNIGYAGLGKDADLFTDNGRSLRALPAQEIASAAQGIATWLATRSADVICVQENADAGFLTRKVAVRRIIDHALVNRQAVFWSDMKTVFVPRALKLNHGMSVHSRVRLAQCRAELLPEDNTYHLGVLKKHYGMLISRLKREDCARDWVVINVHLSAYDDGGQTRRSQVQRVMEIAHKAYDAGDFVVIAGDWNMRLSATDFAHKTAQENLFWVRDFPHEFLPQGWRVVIDKETPTVRSLNAAFRPDHSYTTIVDGFVISPNVDLVQISTAPMGFNWTDHHPVEAQFVAGK